jgi:hypothetical protein
MLTMAKMGLNSFSLCPRQFRLSFLKKMAVASYLGLKEHLFKETEAKRGSNDLPGIDVKTRSKLRYDLIVQKQEDPRKKFVLVTIENQKNLDPRLVLRT